MEQKLCRICGQLKDVNNFQKDKKMVSGHRNECNVCKNKLYYDRQKIRESNLEKEIKTEGLKVCRVCEIEKDINEFHVKKGTPDGHRRECKECVKDIQKKYKDAPDFKEKRKEYDEQRYSEKKDQILERKKEYYQEKKESILEAKKEYRSKPEYKIQVKKWRTDNIEHLAFLQSIYRKKYPHVIAWRTILHSTLKRLGSKKEGHCIEMLGYSAIDLKESFDKDSSMSEVCSLANLQPLWATENLSKGNKKSQE
jgi:hypothetical protein